MTLIGSVALLVNEDRVVGGMLAGFMASHGLVTHVVPDGAGVWARLAQGPVDVVAIDVTQRESDGILLTSDLRQRSRIPIVLMADGADFRQRVRGLEGGADDFLTGPVEPRELVARIHAILRHAGPPRPPVSVEDDVLIRFGGWVLDPGVRGLQDPHGLPVSLARAEFQLLHTLLCHPGRLLTREQLRRAVSGDGDDYGMRSVDLLISRLRQKLLRAPGAPVLIRTIRGHGYLFDVRPEFLRRG